jgi:hypothetical protein
MREPQGACVATRYKPVVRIAQGGTIRRFEGRVEHPATATPGTSGRLAREGIAAEAQVLVAAGPVDSPNAAAKTGFSR